MNIKSFVIVVDESVSIEQSKDCINSFKKIGLLVEKFPGVYKHNLDTIWKSENLFLYHKLSENKKTKGVKGYGSRFVKIC